MKMNTWLPTDPDDFRNIQRWVDRQIKKMEQGTFDAADAARTRPKGDVEGTESTDGAEATAEEEEDDEMEDGDDEVDAMDVDGDEEDEEDFENDSDDEEVVAFVEAIRSYVGKGPDHPPPLAIKEHRRNVQEEHMQVKRLLHATDLAAQALNDTRTQLEFRKTEHIRVTHYCKVSLRRHSDPR